MDQMLTSMGFAPTIVHAAYQTCGDNMEACIEYCLNPPPKAEPLSSVPSPPKEVQAASFWGGSAPKRHTFSSKKKAQTAFPTKPSTKPRRAVARETPVVEAPFMEAEASPVPSMTSPTKRPRKTPGKPDSQKMLVRAKPSISSGGPATVVLLRWVDIRLDDNQALSFASSRGGPVVLLFTYDPSEQDEDGQWSLNQARAARLWLHHALKSLDHDIQARYGNRIVFRKQRMAEDPNPNPFVDPGPDSNPNQTHSLPYNLPSKSCSGS